MRILIVEDDIRISAFVKRGLEAEGYGIDVVQTGHDGVNMGSGQYHLIILDLMLPDLSGLEVCQQLRHEQIHTPILMLTAKDAIQDKVQGFQSGADDYVTKPFAFDELLARIKALLRRGPYQEIQEELIVADLRLNRETREVWRGTTQLTLTSKEFALLECLMTNTNKPVSRTTILDQVWGYQYDPLTNVVDVYVGYLRKKVDSSFSKKLIQTVRDVGYKIEG